MYPATLDRGPTRTPRLAGGLEDIELSVFESLDRRLRASGRDDIAALHQGKTTYPPAVTPGEAAADFDLLAHQHAPPAGSRQLRQSIARHVSARWGEIVEPERIIVTCGATHAISTILRATVAPGDEVLILSPQWLFASGLIRAARAEPIEVPVFVELSEDPTFDLVERIGRAIGPRTQAIYFNSPNNPTGFALTDAQQRDLVDLARHHGLWLIADNAYENYDFTSAGFRDVAAVGSDCTFAVHTFSKTYAMAGYRVGYLVAPPGTSTALEKLGLHSVYAVSSVSQSAAARALETPRADLDARRGWAASARDVVDEQLAVPHTTVDGGLYTFLDLRDLADPAAMIDGCLAVGVSLAPGAAFGTAHHEWARLCFTAVSQDALPSAIDRINRVHRRLR